MKRIFAMILGMWGFVFAYSFLTNGDFEEPLTIGWSQEVNDSSIINRDTGYDPDPDYEACVYHGTGTGYTKLYQIVDVATTDLEFSVNAKLHASGTSWTCWAGAAIWIGYFDESEALLGCTRICSRTQSCPWSDTDSSHVIEAPDTLWHTYAFNIDEELTNIPTVEGSDVKKIMITLHAECSSG